MARLRGSGGSVLTGKVFLANVFAHLVLDTVVGGIRWLAPFSGRQFAFVVVPARHPWWVSNFLLHWTFLLEIAITACAIFELRRARANATPECVDRSRPVSAQEGWGGAA